jgi:hypothetical protein
MRSFLPALSGKDYLRLFATSLIILEFFILYGLIQTYPTLSCLGYDVIEIIKKFVIEALLIWLQEWFSFF